jgi:hypothetical protein
MVMFLSIAVSACRMIEDRPPSSATATAEGEPRDPQECYDTAEKFKNLKDKVSHKFILVCCEKYQAQLQSTCPVLFSKNCAPTEQDRFYREQYRQHEAKLAAMSEKDREAHCKNYGVRLRESFHDLYEKYCLKKDASALNGC